MDCRLAAAELYAFQADAVAEGAAFNLPQTGREPDGKDAPFVEKGAFADFLNPLRNLHMLQVGEESHQAPAVQLHHPQNVHRNGAHRQRDVHLPGHHLHRVRKGEPLAVRKGDLRNPAAAREDIAEALFLQIRGNLQSLQQHVIDEHLSSQPFHTGDARLGQAVAVEEHAVPQLFHRRGKGHGFQAVAAVERVLSHIGDAAGNLDFL